MTQHLGMPIPSPALLEKIGTKFRRSVESYAPSQRDPVGQVRKGRPQDRRDGSPTCSTRPRTGRSAGGGDRGGAGVPAGLVRLPARHEDGGSAVHLRQGRPPGDLLLLLPVGRGFRRRRSSRSAPTSLTRPRSGSTGTSGPSGRPLKAGIGFTELSNGFAVLRRPRRAAGHLRPAAARHHRGVRPAVAAPAPAALRSQRTAGRVLVGVLHAPGRGLPHHRLRRPAPGPAFFEALIADNLDIGRPANVEIIFGRQIRRDTPGIFRTAIDRPVIGPDTGGVVLNVFYKHSRIKQYLKDGRAMRIETVINSPPRPGLQRPAAQPRRAAGQGPRGQRPHTGCRTCRPGHRPCESSL